MDKKCFALIMAGGQGTRFWPWSTADRPKQFLPVVGSESLLAQTYHRLKKFIEEDNIYVIAEKRYQRPTAICLPGFSHSRYIVEPAPRNTAPSLVMANILLSRICEDARLLVVPADHYVPDEKLFAEQLTAALVQAEEECIVTAGIQPSQPHTGYGYICFDSDSFQETGRERFYRVLAFKEKPDRALAQRYIAEGNFFWNSGMFLYKLRNFREFLRRYSPYYSEQYRLLESAGRAKFARIFRDIRPDSIDYALMEKVEETRMFKARFFWNDVGSWSSLLEIGAKSGDGNVTCGDPILLSCKNSLVYAMESKPVAVIGLKNVAIVDTPNGLLVSSVDDLQRIKEIFPKIVEKSGR